MRVRSTAALLLTLAATVAAPSAASAALIPPVKIAPIAVPTVPKGVQPPVTGAITYANAQVASAVKIVNGYLTVINCHAAPCAP